MKKMYVVVEKNTNSVGELEDSLETAKEWMKWNQNNNSQLIPMQIYRLVPGPVKAKSKRGK